MRFALFLIPFLMLGCVSNPVSPTVRLTQAGDILNTSEKLLIIADKQGLIPASEGPKIKAVVDSAEGLYASAVEHKGDTKFDSIMITLQKALDDIVLYRTAYGKQP